MNASTRGQLLVSLALVVGTSALVGAVAGQAKARSSEDLLHAKQLSLGALIYSGDADDLFPLAFARTPNGGYRPDARFTLRGDGDATKTNWATAMYPYMKSATIYSAVGAPRVAVEGDPNPSLPAVGHQFNGLLNAYSSVAVASPSGTVMFTQAYGMANLEGWAVANPEMTCVANQPCVYKPAQKGCGGPEPGTTSRLRATNAPQTISETGLDKNGLDGKSKERYQVLAFVDGSAHRIRFDDAPQTEPYPADGFFWSRLDADGKAKAAWTDALGCHPLRFRPDYDPETDPKRARETPR